MEYPCRECERGHACGMDCVCAKWEEWFRQEWREIREMFGKEKHG